MNTFAQYFLWLGSLIFLTSCGEAYQMSMLSKPTTQQKPMGHLEAKIDSITVQSTEAFPVRSTVTVIGRLPTKCNKIQEVEQTLRDNVFEVKLLIDPILFTNCPVAEEKFTQKIDLPVDGLKAGEYVVNVNGVVTSFTLKQDNYRHVQH